MPLSPHSQPSALVMPSTADFEAQYAVYPAGWPSSPRADDIRITLPPWPCLSICRPAARATSQLCVTLASITSRKSSGFWSTIFDTLFCPDATTRMSTRPNFFTAASTIASQFASELGRFATVSSLPPSFSHSAATFFNSAALLAQSTTLAPAPASTFAASAPKAPVAPVTIAVLPRMSNRDSGFFRKSSDITDSDIMRVFSTRHCGMTESAARPRASLLRCRDCDQHGHDLVAAINDFSAFVWADEAGVVGLEYGLLPPGDQGELPRQHVVDLLRGRGVRAGAAAGQEMRNADGELLRSAGVEPEQTQRAIATMVGRLVRLRIAKMFNFHF